MNMAVPKIWRGIPEFYNLQGSLCGDCGEKSFPKREVCTKCHSINSTPHRFIGKGKIETYTIIRTPITDSEGENLEIPARNIPYVMAIVRLEEGPCLTTQIVDCEPGQEFIGKDVEMVFRKIMERGSKGVIQYGYKFRLV